MSLRNWYYCYLWDCFHQAKVRVTSLKWVQNPFLNDITIAFALWKWGTINFESGPLEFDPGYLILEPVAQVGYLD